MEQGFFAIGGAIVGAAGGLLGGWLLQKREWRRREDMAGRALKIELLENSNRVLQWSGKPIRRDVFDRLLPELSSLMGPQIMDVFDAYRLLESLLDDGKQAAEVRQAGDIDMADHLDLGLSQNMKHVFATIEDLERKIGWKGDQRTYRDF